MRKTSDWFERGKATKQRRDKICECPTTKSAPIEFVTIEHHCDGKTDNIHNRLTADEENPPKSYTSPVIHPPKCPKIALCIILTILLLSKKLVHKLVHGKVQVDKVGGGGATLISNFFELS